MTIKTAIIIPARYGSTRLPGKPLAMIAGQTMLKRVVGIAKAAAADIAHVSVVVATDDERIAQHCTEIGITCLMTPPECATGTDRIAAAMGQLEEAPDFIMNMQGDAPLTPPDFLTAMIKSFIESPCDVVTPVTQLSWEQLDRLRIDKKTTPFSGACAIFDQITYKAFWFSKNIIPAMRNEATLRMSGELTPVFRHIGLYGYAQAMLETYSSLPRGQFEELEGLEQLRVIENGFTLRCVPVSYAGRASMSGVDSPEDILRAEALIAEHGELVPESACAQAKQAAT